MLWNWDPLLSLEEMDHWISYLLCLEWLCCLPCLVRLKRDGLAQRTDTAVTKGIKNYSRTGDAKCVWEKSHFMLINGTSGLRGRIWILLMSVWCSSKDWGEKLQLDVVMCRTEEGVRVFVWFPPPPPPVMVKRNIIPCSYFYWCFISFSLSLKISHISCFPLLSVYAFSAPFRLHFSWLEWEALEQWFLILAIKVCPSEIKGEKMK